MKNLIKILIIGVCVFITSCSSSAQIAYDDYVVADPVEYSGRLYYPYYMDDYYIGQTPIIYVNGLYWYQYYTVGLGWYRVLVPRDLWYTWRISSYHNRYLGGYWVNRYPPTGHRFHRNHYYHPYTGHGNTGNHGPYRPNMNNGHNNRGGMQHGTGNVHHGSGNNRSNTHYQGTNSGRPSNNAGRNTYRPQHQPTSRSTTGSQHSTSRSSVPHGGTTRGGRR